MARSVCVFLLLHILSLFREVTPYPFVATASLAAPPPKNDVAAPTSSSVVDFDREIAHMESYDSYVLVSVLTSTISFTTLLSFSLQDNTQSWRSLKLAFQIVASLSTLASIYSTVIFSLTILYGKSALGMHKDKAYAHFLSQTSSIRIRGFRAFSASLLLFALEVTLVMLERVQPLPLQSTVAMGVLATVALVWLYRDWNTIVQNATPIYQAEAGVNP